MTTITNNIPLSELPLRPSTLSLLTRRGYVSTKEVLQTVGGLATLAAELDVPLPEAARILREVQSCCCVVVDDNDEHNDKDRPMTAQELMQQQQNHRRHNNNHIVTFAKQVDQLLGGGIALGQLTEIAGMPGTGKTQLAMQLCVLCRLPKIFGGVEGRALYIDAEGSFAPERCQQMAHALVQHVQHKQKQSQQQQRQQQQQRPESSSFTVRDILESIQVFRVHDETSQTATLRNLTNHTILSSATTTTTTNSTTNANEGLPVKLIVVDSIAFHYRAITPTSKHYYIQRTQELVQLASFLSDLARTHHLAVVCLNQMTTKFTTQHSSNSSQLVPALGESWAHAVATRLLLSSQDVGKFTCRLVKSAHRPSGSATFQILPQGIRGVPPPTATIVASSTTRTPARTPATRPPLRPTNQALRAVTPHSNSKNQQYAPNDSHKRRRILHGP